MRIVLRKQAAFTLVEIMIVVAVLGLLMAIAIPNFAKARESSQLNSILNNVRVLDEAKEIWATETRQRTGAVPDMDDLKGYLRGGRIEPVVGEFYVPNPVGMSAGASLPSGTALAQYAAGAFISLP